MNQVQRDRLIDRYMTRRMSPAEEAEFTRLLESDAVLRRMLETDRAVNATLLRDRDAVPVSDIEARSNLLSMLGALPAADATAPAGLARVLSGGVVKGIVGLVVAGALAVGYFAATRPSSPGRAVPAPAVTATGQAAQPAPPMPVGTSRTPADAAPETAHAAKPAEPTPTVRPAPARAADARVSVKEQPRAAHEAVAAPTSAAHAESVPRETEEPSRSALRTRDTMRVNVSINLDRMGRRPR